MSPLGPCASLSPCAPYVLLYLHVPFLCHYAPNVPPMYPNASTRPHVSPLCSSYPYVHCMFLYIPIYPSMPPYGTYVPTYLTYVPYVSPMLSVTLCSLIQLMSPLMPLENLAKNTEWSFYRHRCD